MEESQAESFKQGDIVADKKSGNLYIIGKQGISTIHRFIEESDGLPISSLEDKIADANHTIKAYSRPGCLGGGCYEDKRQRELSKAQAKLEPLTEEKAKLEALAKESKVGLTNPDRNEIRPATEAEYVFGQMFSYIIRLDRLEKITQVDFSPDPRYVADEESKIRRIKGDYLPPVRRMQKEGLERRMAYTKKQMGLYQKLQGLFGEGQEDTNKKKEANAVSFSLSGLSICSHIEGMFMDALLKTDIYLTEWLRELSDMNHRRDISYLQEQCNSLHDYCVTLELTISGELEYRAMVAKMNDIALQQWGQMMANISDIANGRKLGMVYSEAFGVMPAHWRWLRRGELPPSDGVI